MSLGAETKLDHPVLLCCLALVAFLFDRGMLRGKTKLPAREALKPLSIGPYNIGSFLAKNWQFGRLISKNSKIDYFRI